MDDFDDLIERFDHVAFAVRDIAAAVPFFRFLGGRFLQGGDNARNGFRWVQFRLPTSGKVELIQPLTADCFLRPFLDTRGEGVHHLTFKVADLDAVISRAGDLGLETVGEHRHPDWSEVFVHPRSAHGTVVQMAEWTDSGRWSGPTLDEVLAGRSIDES